RPGRAIRPRPSSTVLPLKSADTEAPPIQTILPASIASAPLRSTASLLSMVTTSQPVTKMSTGRGSRASMLSPPPSEQLVGLFRNLEVDDRGNIRQIVAAGSTRSRHHRAGDHIAVESQQGSRRSCAHNGNLQFILAILLQKIEAVVLAELVDHQL